MYKVLDVCNYVIKYSNDKNYGISNLKLQKVLYYIQAHFLIHSKNSSPCFEEPIEAWDFGPVVYVAYSRYRSYGNLDIFNHYNSFFGEKDCTYDLINENDKKMIETVIDKLANLSAVDLVNQTHREDPWKKAYKKHENKEITIESMRKYFCENKE